MGFQALSHSSIGTAPNGAAEQAFTLQYTALILIVLTFVIGAFVKPAAPPEPEHFSSPHIEVKKPTLHTSGVIHYDDLFHGDTTKLNSAVSTAVSQFLSSHDIEADIEVYGAKPDSETTPEAAINLALARSTELLNLLTSSGIPADAVRVYAQPFGEQQVQITVLMREDGEQ